jgi:hypothetical protein
MAQWSKWLGHTFMSGFKHVQLADKERKDKERNAKCNKREQARESLPDKASLQRSI